MKHKLKNYLKLGILLFGISLTVFSCINDDFQNVDQIKSEVKSPPELIVTIHRGGKLLTTNLKLKEQLYKLIDKKKNFSSNDYRTISSNEYNFSIDTTYIQLISTVTYNSYTFIVERQDSDSDILENYIYTEFNDGSSRQYLVSYPILNSNSENIYDINNAQLQSINDSSLIFNRNGSCVSLIAYEEPVCTYTKCYENEHSLNVDGWQNCIYFDLGYGIPTKTCTDGAWIDQGCPTTNGSTSSGTTSGTGTTTGTNSNNNNPDDTEEEDQDEVIVPFASKRECEKIKTNISDKPVIKTRLHQLKVASSDTEKGLRVDKNPTTGEYVPSAILNSGNSSRFAKIFVNPYTVVIAHSHPESDVYAMFSGPDITKMGNIANYVQNNTDTTVEFLSITHILVVDGLTFALRFDDMQSVQKLIDIYNDRKKRANFEKNLQKYYESDYNAITYLPDTDIYKQQRHIFNLLAEYNLSMSLYEANYDSDGFVNGWQKINKETLAKVPCN